jgi:4-hydroxy-tetrahydrodipicolinate reductase
MLVAEIVASEGCALAGGCAKPGTGYINQDIGELAGVGRLGISVGDSTEKLIRDSDVVIEFTTPAATATHAAQAAGLGKAMVIGTTGLSVEESDGVRQASRRIPIVWAPNMSLGINLLLGLVEDVARRLGPEWDVEIMEMHHRGKVDAPSGTALALGRAVAERRSNECSNVVGTASPVLAAPGTSALPRCAAAMRSATTMWSLPEPASASRRSTGRRAGRSTRRVQCRRRAGSPVGRRGFTA